MTKIFIIGAGSIGNHLTNAAIKDKYEVYITDKSSEALYRMKKELFKKRYGYWSNKIRIIKFNDLDKIYNIKFELVIIGTPPSSHLSLFNFCKKNFKYKKIMIEKPLAVFNQNFNKLPKKDFVFCGYNHSVSPSFLYLLNLIVKNKEKILFSSIKCKEGWTGILNAHYWLKDEFSTYLGNIYKGGGAIHEHSHPIHLAVIILKNLTKNNIEVINSNLQFKKKTNKMYDCHARMLLKSNKNKIDIEIDLLEPGSSKEISIYLPNKLIRWIHNYDKSNDAVIIYKNNKSKVNLFKKKRETEFINEIRALKKVNNFKKYNQSNLNAKHAATVMKIIKKVIKNEDLRSN